MFDRLIECGNDTNQHFSVEDCKRAYILTDQGLSTTNKSLKSILVNMNLENAYRESLEELGYGLDEIYKLDDENRNKFVKNCRASSDTTNTYNNNLTDIAESLIDSLATLELPAWGYGLRYKFGNIKQYTNNKIAQYTPPNYRQNDGRKANKISSTSEVSQKKDFSKNPLEI